MVGHGEDAPVTAPPALRDYQERLLGDAARALHAHRTVVAQLGTGGGKTHAAITAIARRLAAKPSSRVLFVAGLDAILEDTVRRGRAAGLHVGLVQAGRPADPTAPVQVCSQQTLAGRDELPPAGFVIVDECHHACAATVRGTLERYPTARLLGLTATPQRGDGRPLGDVFEALVCGPDNAWLTANGFLVPMDVVAPQAPLKGLACTAAEAYARWAGGRRAIVFCRTVAQAERDAEALRERGVPAATLHGQSPRAARESAREQLVDGSLRAVCTVGVAREGWDCPAVEVAIFACAVGVVGPWLQMLGRVSRPSPATGKRRALAVDLAGSWVELGLRDDARVWSLHGDAVRPAAEKLAPVMRCRECGALFPPATRCVRCGALRESLERVQRILSRADRLALVSALPQAERDRRYLASLIKVAAGNMRLDGRAAEQWALRTFRARRGRDPEVAA
jgi:DNA repair protein RadD